MLPYVYAITTNLAIDYFNSVCRKKRKSVYLELQELEDKRQIKKLVKQFDE